MKLLSSEKPLIVLPQLSAAIGLNEALILQQIHYWVEKAGELKDDGFKWFYKTYKKWAVELPFLSIGTIRRAIAFLRERGLILVEQHSLKTLYRANWYTVNYEAVQELLESICPKQARRDAKSDRVDVINVSIPPYIETTPKENISTDTPPTLPKSQSVFEKFSLVEWEFWQLNWDALVAVISSEIESLALNPPSGKKQPSDESKFSAVAEVFRIFGGSQGDKETRKLLRNGIENPNFPTQLPPPPLPPHPTTSIPFEDELKIRGVNLLDPRIHKAIASSSDPYLSIKAWLEWSSTQVVESPTGSLLAALRSGWRPRNMDERPRRSVIPDLPPELQKWASQKRSIIREIIWSDLEKQWVVFLHGEPPLPAIQAMSLFP